MPKGTNTEEIVSEETADVTVVAQEKLDRANEALAKAQAAVVGAGSDLKAMMLAAAELMAAGRNQEKAQRVFDDSQFEVKAAERMAFSVALKEKVGEFVAELNLATMLSLGLKGITITLDPESVNNPLISVLGETRAKAAAKASTGERQARDGGASNVLYQGNLYKASEFIIEFGGEDGAKAIDKARNFKDYDLKTSPGFDQFKRKLMKELGATFADGRQPE